jgi:hypothetical protein
MEWWNAGKLELWDFSESDRPFNQDVIRIFIPNIPVSPYSTFLIYELSERTCSDPLHPLRWEKFTPVPDTFQ